VGDSSQKSDSLRSFLFSFSRFIEVFTSRSFHFTQRANEKTRLAPGFFGLCRVGGIIRAARFPVRNAAQK